MHQASLQYKRQSSSHRLSKREHLELSSPTQRVRGHVSRFTRPLTYYSLLVTIPVHSHVRNPRPRGITPPRALSSSSKTKAGCAPVPPSSATSLRRPSP